MTRALQNSLQTGRKNLALSNRPMGKKPETKRANTDAYVKARAHTGQKAFAPRKI